ncbi:hypothetical protein VNO78_33668 [Psophocarpus tetragonolobus]|uniref:Uncharacterized protein n=1 Tax=Psophocarpus tetragonolobus TaxID=3891 RepID=A0AAN9P1K6_PSOTE
MQIIFSQFSSARCNSLRTESLLEEKFQFWKQRKREERGKMSSESRPVPRRESPWGITGENHPEPKAHRCNDRVEDVIQACFEGNPFKTVPGPFKLFWQCMRSKPGEEPTEPFTYLDLDPPKRETKPVKPE